jgi:hypothetical protein
METFADAILYKSLKREMQLRHLVREHHEGRWIGSHLAM